MYAIFWRGGGGGCRERERNVLFNDALNTFYLRLYGVRHMVKDHSDSEKGTSCRHIGYSYRLTARVIVYAPSHRQDNTYHGLCYTSRGALAGTRNSSKGPPHEGSIRRPITPWANALPLSYVPLPGDGGGRGTALINYIYIYIYIYIYMGQVIEKRTIGAGQAKII